MRSTSAPEMRSTPAPEMRSAITPEMEWELATELMDGADMELEQALRAELGLPLYDFPASNNNQSSPITDATQPAHLTADPTLTAAVGNEVPNTTDADAAAIAPASTSEWSPVEAFPNVNPSDTTTAATAANGTGCNPFSSDEQMMNASLFDIPASPPPTLTPPAVAPPALTPSDLAPPALNLPAMVPPAELQSELAAFLDQTPSTSSPFASEQEKRAFEDFYGEP
jgi:hypothetical protein